MELEKQALPGRSPQQLAAAAKTIPRHARKLSQIYCSSRNSDLVPSTRVAPQDKQERRPRQNKTLYWPVGLKRDGSGDSALTARLAAPCSGRIYAFILATHPLLNKSHIGEFQAAPIASCLRRPRRRGGPRTSRNGYK